jgi:hypothetical protein
LIALSSSPASVAADAGAARIFEVFTGF